MQTVAVILLVAAAAFFLVRRLVQVFRTGKSPCGCCESGTCPAASQDNKGTVLEDHREDSSSGTSNGENT